MAVGRGSRRGVCTVGMSGTQQGDKKKWLHNPALLRGGAGGAKMPDWLPHPGRLRGPQQRDKIIVAT